MSHTTVTTSSHNDFWIKTQVRMSKMSNPVVTHQPGSGGYGTNVQTGEWSTGLCSCCTDLFVCECWTRCLKWWLLSVLYFTNSYLSHSGALGFFCPTILNCYTANKYGENCCLGCLPGGMTAMRTHMRLTYGIQVSCNCVEKSLVSRTVFFFWWFDTY